MAPSRGVSHMSDQAAVQTCLRCGARNAPEAQFCGACGQALINVPGDAAGEWLPAPLAPGSWQEHAPSGGLSGPDAPPAERDVGERSNVVSEAPEEPIAQKRCAWCSALNSWVAVVCEQCGAHFPVPEQDEAFRRAAEERMRHDLESLNFWSQRRRRGWRRFLI
jgi:ribosomal protein L40E